MNITITCDNNIDWSMRHRANEAPYTEIEIVSRLGLDSKMTKGKGKATKIHGGDRLTRKCSRELETALCVDAKKKDLVSVCMYDTENET